MMKVRECKCRACSAAFQASRDVEFASNMVTAAILRAKPDFSRCREFDEVRFPGKCFVEVESLAPTHLMNMLSAGRMAALLIHLRKSHQIKEEGVAV